jgi:arabinofuranan 3-O-arabinosyltransferase
LTDSLWIANVSLLLAPVAVVVLLLYESAHWRGGSALLVVSLLIKPLLIPLILLPLLRGQWRAIIAAALGGCVLLAAAIALVPGGGHFFAVLRFLENGGTLTRGAAVYNVSIRGLAQRLGGAAWGSLARAAVLTATAALALRFARRPPARGDVAAMGTLLLLALLLAGSLTEDHYLLVAAPCLLCALALWHRFDALLVALPGIALFAFPVRYIGNVATSPAGLQVRFVLAELLLAAAPAIFIARARGRAGNVRPPAPFI